MTLRKPWLLVIAHANHRIGHLQRLCDILTDKMFPIRAGGFFN